MIYYFGNECDTHSICYTYDLALYQEIHKYQNNKPHRSKARYFFQLLYRSPDPSWNLINSVEEFEEYFQRYIKGRIFNLHIKALNMSTEIINLQARIDQLKYITEYDKREEKILESYKP